MSDHPKEHNPVPVSVASPRLCSMCEDYIVSPKCTARQCFSCAHLFHSVCAQRALRLHEPCPGNQISDSASYYVALSVKETAIALSEQPLINWSCEQIIQWLVVVGFTRYTSLFLICNINGRSLDFLLNPPTPISDIKDVFARRALTRAIMTLLGKLPSPGDRIIIDDYINMKVQDSPHKNLRLTNFTTELNCCVCGLALLGLVWQGYHCADCGLVLHRLCRAFVEEHPPCSPGTLRLSAAVTDDDAIKEAWEVELLQDLPTFSPPIKHLYLGVPLDTQECDSDNVPLFLTACTHYFEQIVTESESVGAEAGMSVIDCPKVYKQSAQAHDLQQLSSCYADRLPGSSPVTDDTLISAEQKLVRIAQLVKHFLRELPEPVIPCYLYKMTIALVEPSLSISQRSAALYTLLASLPPRNFATIRHIMRHLGFILCHQNLMKLRLSKSGSNIPAVGIDQPENPQVLLHIFSQILLRPTWPDILRLATSCAKEVHLSVLEIIFEHFLQSPRVLDDKSCTRTPSQSVSSYEYYADLLSQSGGGLQMQSQVSISKAPTQTSVARNRTDLEERDWYWGDISKAEVADVMQGQPEGAFLVRDASNGSASAFTLTERRNFSNILFRIYHREDSFGLTNPPPGFPLVSKLISFYMEQASISTSPAVGVQSVIIPRLLEPVSRFHYQFHLDRTPGVSRPLSAADLETSQLVDALRKRLHEVADQKKEIDRLNCHASVYLQQMGTRTNLMRGLNKANDWLKASKLRFLQNVSCTTSFNVQTTMLVKRCQTVLDDRLTGVKVRIEKEHMEHNRLLDCTREVSERQVVHLASQNLLSRQIQEIRRELKRRGVGHEYIFVSGDLATSPNTHAPSKPNIDFSGKGTDAIMSQRGLATISQLQNRTTWFVENISRKQADDILASMSTGAFLIRPSTVPKRFALSVKVVNSVQHCLIYCVNSLYGFTETTCEFQSLDELVTFYHFTSLIEHNNLLDTTLAYPAYATEMQQPSP